MQIEITGEAEILIKSALASGKYASAEEFIAAMAKRLQAEEPSRPMARMPKHLDLDALAAAQGVGPICDFRDLKADFWPEGESVDEFIRDIRELRDADEPRLR